MGVRVAVRTDQRSFRYCCKHLRRTKIPSGSLVLPGGCLARGVTLGSWVALGRLGRILLLDAQAYVGGEQYGFPIGSQPRLKVGWRSWRSHSGHEDEDVRFE